MNKFLAVPILVTILLLASAVPYRAKAREDAAPQPSSAASIELKDPVAVVNGRKISAAELRQNIEQQIARSGRTMDQIPAENLLRGYHAVLDEMIIDALLEEKSADVEVADKEIEENVSRFKSQFSSEEEMKRVLQQNGDSLEDVKMAIGQNLKKRTWIMQRLGDAEEPSDEEVKAFYEENKEGFAEPEMVRASHILLLTPETLTDEEVAEKKRAIEDLKKRIDEGADFAEIAREFSEDPGSRENGGDLDFFSRERMVPEFSEAAFAADKGSVVGPVKTQFGFHLIKVTDRKEARTVPVEEASAQIKQYLGELKQQQKLRQLFTALKQQADVAIHLPPLPAQDGAASSSSE